MSDFEHHTCCYQCGQRLPLKLLKEREAFVRREMAQWQLYPSGAHLGCGWLFYWIGPKLRENLQAAGFHTASDLSRRSLESVRGVGPVTLELLDYQREQAIDYLRREWSAVDGEEEETHAA